MGVLVIYLQFYSSTRSSGSNQDRDLILFMELGSGIRSPLEAGDWEGIGDLIPSRGKGSGIGSMGQKLDHDPQSGIIGSLV